jgi:predicted nuclease of predicted toxin-antitoxin system
MRVLLDECLPRKLKREFTEHEATTVPEMGWAGKKNGELMRLMTGQFEVFVTIDQNLTYQQNLSNAAVAVVMLAAPDNRLKTLKPLIPQVQETLKTIKPGDIVRVNT